MLSKRVTLTHMDQANPEKGQAPSTQNHANSVYQETCKQFEFLIRVSPNPNNKIMNTDRINSNNLTSHSVESICGLLKNMSSQHTFYIRLIACVPRDPRTVT